MTKLINIKQWQADNRTQESIKALKDKAVENKWQHFVDGLPVVEQLEKFMIELKNVMPNIWFIPTDHEYQHIEVRDEKGDYQTTINFRIINEVAVCLNEFPFDLGRINYQDNSVKQKKDKTYGVYSRKIQNDKFSQRRDQYNMIMGKDLKKALKTAQTYLMPYSVKELAQAFYEPLRSNVHSEFSKVQHKAQSLANIVSNNYLNILEEIRALKKAGIQFHTEPFREVADQVDEVYGLFEAEGKRNIGGTFVRFYKVGDESYVTLQEATDVKTSWGKAKVEASTVGYKASELPQDIVASVSVLSILNDGQYVKDVGMRVDESHFWIERG